MTCTRSVWRRVRATTNRVAASSTRSCSFPSDSRRPKSSLRRMTTTAPRARPRRASGNRDRRNSHLPPLRYRRRGGANRRAARGAELCKASRGHGRGREPGRQWGDQVLEWRRRRVRVCLCSVFVPDIGRTLTLRHLFKQDRSPALLARVDPVAQSPAHRRVGHALLHVRIPFRHPRAICRHEPDCGGCAWHIFARLIISA